MRLIEVVRATAVAITLALAGPAVAAKPNFVFIVTDDMSADMMRFMPLTKSRIADHGVTFEQAFVNLPLCSPGRASILTGRYAHNHRVLHNDPAAGGSFQTFRATGGDRSTIATRLDAAGYRTGLFGKYMNNYNGPNASYIPPGWDRWFAVTYNGTDYNWGVSDQGVKRTYASRPQDYSVDVQVAKARDFIRNSGTTPFFLYLAFGVPHYPVDPAARHAGLFAAAQVPRTVAFNEADVADKPGFFQRPALDPAEVATLDLQWGRMLAALQSVDEAVRTIYDTLRSTGRLAETWIIFTSDNGQHLGQHRLPVGKQTAYEEDLRVPFLIRGPKGKAGIVDKTHMLVNVDIAPTILALAGLVVPSGMDGRSAASLILKGPTPAVWRTAFPIERYLAPGDSFGPWPGMRGVRTENWTWAEWQDGQRELYDVASDPYQIDNRAADPQLANLRQRLAALTETLATCAGQACRDVEDALP